MTPQCAGEYCYQAYQGRNSVCEQCPVVISFRDGGIHIMERTVPTERGQRYIEIASSLLKDSEGKVIAGIEVVRDVTERKILEAEREQLIADLRKALEKIKTLKGLIPVCAWCKKVRDDKGTGKNSNITFANTQMLTSLMEYVRTV